MKTYKTILLVAGIFVALFGLTPKTWAAGNSFGSTCTLATNLGQGTVTLRGTVAAEAHNLVPDGAGGFSAVSDVDLTLRLERSGVTKFFRKNNVVNDFSGATNEDIICIFITDNPLSNPPFVSLRSEILEAFGLDPTKWNLVLTSKSISNASESGLIPGAGSLSGIADVTIYAVRQ